VVRADQPLLKVPDRAVRQGHHRSSARPERGSLRLFERDVIEAGGLQAREGPQAIGVDRRARSDVALKEGAHCGRLEIREDVQPDATRAVAASFNGHKHGDGSPALELSAPTQSGLRTADPGVVDFHLTVERFAGGIHHGAPQLVEHHPRRFVAAQAQLPLQQQRRDPSLVGRHEVRGPEPPRERHLGVVQDRPGRQGDLVPTGGTLSRASRHDRVRPSVTTAPTPKPVRPPTPHQVLLTRFFGGELTLKLVQISRKRRARHAGTLLMVGS
jgi:hypothetical protein